MSDKHVFALYTKNISSTNLGLNASISLVDMELWHRVHTVLHLQAGEEVIFFNESCIIQCNLTSTSKKGCVVGGIQHIASPQILQPPLHLFQAVLKRDAMGEVAYAAAQMGVTSLTLMLTQKVQRSWGGEKEIERLHSIMIAACEQAKQFNIPKIYGPVSLSEILTTLDINHAFSWYANPQGQPIVKMLQQLLAQQIKHINIFIGPEGGFHSQELELFNQQNIPSYALTQSILRSQEAVIVSTGIIRSIAR